ncbi:MAG: hypothetical protein WBY84_12420, partial [Pseudolabrys sp.]
GARRTDRRNRAIHLAVVPLPDQPELPIPSPTASSPPAIALVRSEAVMAEVAFVETPPAPVGVRVNEPELTSRNRRASTRLLCQKVRCHRSWR